jgi:hypothetical protein
MTKNYESMKTKLLGCKIKLKENKENYEHIKMANLNMKKLICNIIKFNHDSE